MQMKALLQSEACSASFPKARIFSHSALSSASSSSWIYLRSLLIMASSTRIRDKSDLSSPSSRMKRNHALSFQEWIDLFSPEGKLLDKAKLLKRIRSGGIEPGIRSEVWPFLLGVHDLDSTEAERNESRMKRREEYQKLRVQCRQRENFTGDYATWQRIIRLDAVRAEWAPCGASQLAVDEAAACMVAEAAELKNFDDLGPCRLHHAACLTVILEAYAVYDPETGYCQGMADLLSPIAAVLEDDSEAFWCFAAFMLHARHNFRLDEEGIRRQLGLVARIIRRRDASLFNHLERHRASDCTFAYRMLVVLLRRELSFEQTLCLWEVLWADQAAVRVGGGRHRRSVRRRKRWEAPPTEDLLLYAVAACVLQRGEVIMEENFGME